MNVAIIGEQYLFLEGIKGVLLSEKIPSSIYLCNEKGIRDLVNGNHDLVIFELDGVKNKEHLKSLREWIPESIFICVMNKATEDAVMMCGELKIEGVLLKDSPSPILMHAVNKVIHGEIYYHDVVTHHLGNIFFQLCDLVDGKEAVISKKKKEELRRKGEQTIRSILSKRELDVFFYLCCGYSNLELSEKLYISDKTVKNHVSRILQKLEVSDRTSAVLKGLHNNYIDLGVIEELKRNEKKLDEIQMA